MRSVLSTLLLFFAIAGNAQVDTVNTGTTRLQTSYLQEGRASYAVFFEDSLGRRISSADIWDRTVHRATNSAGAPTYEFTWKVYRRDSLLSTAVATGLIANLQPLSYSSVSPTRGRKSFLFNQGLVTVPPADRLTAKDSAFSVALNVPAFAFPMDLETFPLLPFKRVGQEWAIAFYEPGNPQGAYYHLKVTGKEALPLPGGASIACWTLRIDYSPTTYATFWITEKTREVLKMQEYFRGRYRYKVRLY